MNNLKFRYVYQHEEDFKIADTRDSIWTLEQIAEGEPNNYIDVCLSSSWKVIDINQYTGLKDKNGKEIFEGDYIRVYDKYMEDGFVSRDEDGSWDVKCKNDNHNLYYLGKDCIEIIGNIYENPELLNS